MNRTKIEWTDNTWNPVTGCLHGCPYCYARKIAKRFKDLFPNGFKPTFHPHRLDLPYRIKHPIKIFTVSMGDLFGDWVPASWIQAIIKVAEDNPQHIFQFLTKNPERYKEFKFPKNCWLGTTVTQQNDVYRILHLVENNSSNIKFVSFEPLLGEIRMLFPDPDNVVNWIIIGAQTNPYRPPKPDWVQKLIRQAKDNGIAIFLKDNLRWPEKIQEFPG